MIDTSTSTAHTPIFRSGDEKADFVSLLDCAYDIMEIWPAKEPYNAALKTEWLKRARELGAEPSW